MFGLVEKDIFVQLQNLTTIDGVAGSQDIVGVAGGRVITSSPNNAKFYPLKDASCSNQECSGPREHKAVTVYDVKTQLSPHKSHNTVNVVQANIEHLLQINPSNQPRALVIPCNIALERGNNISDWTIEKGWNDRSGIVLKTINTLLRKEGVQLDQLLYGKAPNSIADVVTVTLPQNKFCLTTLTLVPLSEFKSTPHTLTSQYTKVANDLRRSSQDSHVILVPVGTTAQYNRVVTTFTNTAYNLCLNQTASLSQEHGVTIACFPESNEAKVLSNPDNPIKQPSNIFTALFESSVDNTPRRGDDKLWKLLKQHFSHIDASLTTEAAFKAHLLETMQQLSGLDICHSTEEYLSSQLLFEPSEDPFCGHIGFSSGQVTPSYWKNSVVPELMARYRRMTQ